VSPAWRRLVAPLPLALVLLAAACTATGTDASEGDVANTVALGGLATDPPTVPAETDTQPSGPRSVVIVGDSISVGANDDYLATMPLDDVSVEAESGIRLRGQRKVLTFVIGADPDVLVVELGTNDLPVYEPAFLDEIDSVLDEASDLPCVRWVIPYAPRAATAVKAVREHLEDAVGRYPNLGLVDWEGMVEDDPTLLSGDGLHPDERGHLALAQAVADSTTSCA
jgi:hypothetical protein